MPARAWGRFAAVSVLWGLPFLFIKIAGEELSPPLLVFLRALIGAAILLPLALHRGALAGLRAQAGGIVILAALDVAAPFLLITAGERLISSSLAAMIVASMPLLVALLAIRFDHAERVRGWRLVGLFVGLAGVALLLGVQVHADARVLAGVLMVLAATVLYAGATLFYNRRFAAAPAVGVVTGMLGASVAMLAVPAALSLPEAVPGARVIASVVALGVGCTALAYWLFYGLVAEVGPGRGAVITYVSPAVAVVAGVVVLGESLDALGVAGLLLILAGSYLSTGGRPPGAQGRLASPVRWTRGPRTLGTEANGYNASGHASPPCRVSP